MQLFKISQTFPVLWYRFSVTAFQGVAYEYGAEMTYPLPEGTSGGLINWVSQASLYISYTCDSYFCIIMIPFFSRSFAHPPSLCFPQPLSIMMVVVGPKFIQLNGKQVPIGGWTIVMLVLIGAVLTRMYN